MATTKVTTDVIDMSGNTGGLTWVKGTTAQRTTTTIGDLRENTETKRTEIYTNQTGTSEWRNLKEAAIDNSFTVNFLVVAGGGGGGGSNVGYTAGGGGGAGGLRTSFGTDSGGGASAENSVSLEPSISYTITVGTGGAAGGGALYTGPNATNGSNSEFSGSTPSFSIISRGGGGGGSAYASPANLTQGGSGGGSTAYNNTPGLHLQMKVLQVEQLLEI